MINVDKLLHFLGGFIIAIVVSLLGYPLLALILAIVVATGKEIYDYYHPLTHTSDGLDLISTVVGGLVALALYNVL
jgi:hypothetical protein